MRARGEDGRALISVVVFVATALLPVLRCAGYVDGSEDDLETQRDRTPSKD